MADALDATFKALDLARFRDHERSAREELMEGRRHVFEAEMKRRLALPLDRWEAVGELDRLPSDARAHLASRANPGGTSN